VSRNAIFNGISVVVLRIVETKKRQIFSMQQEYMGVSLRVMFQGLLCWIGSMKDAQEQVAYCAANKKQRACGLGLHGGHAPADPGSCIWEQVKLREMLHKGRKDKKGPEADEKQTTPDVYRTAVCCQVRVEPSYLQPGDQPGDTSCRV
jgi:hypothetical protein